MHSLMVGRSGAAMESSQITSPNRRKITFARLATCILNVERAKKKSSRAREEELLQAAETGDVARLRTLVQGRDLNIESTDQLGRTPLHLAVVNEHKEAVRFLLDYVDRRRVYQALLSAINLGNEEIAEIIIEHSKYEEISADLKLHGKAFFYQNKFHDDNQFSEEITPLILASQQNRFEVVMALLLKRETIDRPHKCHCTCTDCLEHARRDELKFARSRLNAYRALSSEAYISLSSEDPILTSFRLRREIQQVANEEKYYTSEYSALASKLSEYVVRLLDKVHGNEELNAILNAADECEGETSGELARLQLAIEYKEKKFVAHPSCQKKLTTLWYRGFYKLLKRRSTFIQMTVISTIVLLYPLLSLIYILAPNSVVGRLLKTPCIKFVAQATSYLIFLCLIVIHGQLEQSKLSPERLGDHESVGKLYRLVRHNLSEDIQNLDKLCIRNHKPAVTEICIVFWITGLLWHACKQIYIVGAHAHFINIYNAMDFFMLKFYMASITLSRITEVMVRSSLDFFQQHSSWQKLIGSQPVARYWFYWLNADRFYWDDLDPVHVGEALFAVGNILNFARLFHLLAINEHLGPMLISLERMIKDVMKFMVTFVPIFLAFMVGMYNLYWYYDPSVRNIVEVVDHKITTKAQEGFGTLEYTFRTIFWALFGLKDAKSVELGSGFKSRFTESVGYIVFGVYNWGAVIVLLNMLIAMMTRSFDKIATDQDIEWKFVRSKLYMEYINEGSTLPVPLNIIPTPKSFARQLARVAKSYRQWRNDKRDKSCYGAGDGEESSPIYTMNGGGMTTIPLTQKAFADRVDLDPGSLDRGLSVTDSPPPHAPPPPTSLNSPLGRLQRSEVNQSIDHKKVPPMFRKPTLSLDTPGDNEETRPVIKTVVRRYIFERLLASVVPNEGLYKCSRGSVDLDNIKQQTNLIQEDLHFIKPKMLEQFSFISKEVKTLQKTMSDVRDQLAAMAHAYSDLRQRVVVCAPAPPAPIHSGGSSPSAGHHTPTIQRQWLPPEQPLNALHPWELEHRQGSLSARLHRQNATEDAAKEVSDCQTEVNQRQFAF